MFDQMQVQGCKPDGITHTALIMAMERGGQWVRALEVSYTTGRGEGRGAEGGRRPNRLNLQSLGVCFVGHRHCVVLYFGIMRCLAHSSCGELSFFNPPPDVPPQPPVCLFRLCMVVPFLPPSIAICDLRLISVASACRPLRRCRYTVQVMPMLPCTIVSWRCCGRAAFSWLKSVPCSCGRWLIVMVTSGD